MDEVKKLLEGFADRAADGLPPADIEADVTRGRRALRRIKRRRRVTGVLCVAAVSAAVLAVGDQVKWWNNGSTEVATGEGEKTSRAPATVSEAASPTPMIAEGSETVSTYGAPPVELVANRQPWNSIGCSLAPKGWTPETPIAADRVVLSRSTMRSADVATKVVLQSAPAARSLRSVRVTDAGGRSLQIGTLGGRVTGQVKLGDQWLLVELPAGTADWNDQLLRRFMSSCTVN
ncbi:hypothetical protein E1218_16480 [Kribbella turkmenica]|uniref:Uncharacterized protein n=1 Tax=Kribbella turkmenica TaxID=2530375 RepID=A0A4V6PD74_9ACTN|nr:hypothetical protein [Kribbella turkmenica]TDD24407.1 hypothetical protein E1218_16480 [Kribbella turkmenica]